MQNNKLLRTLGSMKLTLVILGVFAVAIGAATFIETDKGTTAARVLVYDAVWFEALLGLLILNLIASLFIHPVRKRKIGYLITHIGFIVVLISAGITRFYGYEGSMSIREGKSTAHMYSAKEYIQLSAGDETATFPVMLWKPGENNLSRKMRVDGSTYTVHITEYWPRFQKKLLEGPDGSPVVVISATGLGENIALPQGHNLDAEGVGLHFLDPGKTVPASESPYGELAVDLGGEHTHLAVPRTPPAEITVQGYRIKIIKFQPSFRVGVESSPDDPMENPYIKVEVTSPQGVTQEKSLFAFHPDFDMGHSGQASEKLPIDLKYEYDRNVFFFMEDGAFYGMANFALNPPGDGHDHGDPILSGQRFEVTPGALMHSGGFTLRTDATWESAIEQPAMSDNENSPPAVRLVVEDEQGNSGETVVPRFNEVPPLKVGSAWLRAFFGPVKIDLPYRLFLEDFQFVTYPGSQNPAGYESHVRLYDEERGVEGEPVRIYMNHPLTYRGYKHFQSSYDQDRLGTVLTVNHDPGKWPTYFGYFLVGIGLLVTLTRGAWYRARPAARVAMFAMMAALAALPAAAQEVDPHAGHNHPPGEHPETPQQHVHNPTGNFLSEASRAALSELMVQDYRGRMKPLDTLARESVMKVSKKHQWQGWEPMDMFLSWMSHPGYWYAQPILAVRHPELKEILGVSSQTKHVTMRSMFDANNQYRIQGEVQTAHRTPDRDRSKGQRKLISFDERVNVFNMAAQGLSLRVFPVPGDDNDEWVAPGTLDEKVAAAMDPAVFSRYQESFTKLYRGLQQLDDAAVLAGATEIAEIQRTYGASVIPSERSRNAEMTLNRLQPFTWVTVPYLFAFMVLMFAYAWGLARRGAQKFPLKHPLYAFGLLLYVASLLYHGWAYVLRWIASGYAPLSNGYESLIFISVAIGVAGLWYEIKERKGSIGGLGAMLTAFILGVAMLPTFDPAITPLVPVLSSFWLIIHVTVITASYGFLALAAVISLTMLLLFLFKAPGRRTLRRAIADMHGLNWNILIAGLAFLSVGTFLGGVWANESWGRYWGWDPKETWALVTILVYAFVIHFKFVERLDKPITMAAGSFLAISSVAMTYFGVNYFLSGLHSYAQGDAPEVPGWVYVAAVIAVIIVIAAFISDSRRSWTVEEAPAAAPAPTGGKAATG